MFPHHCLPSVCFGNNSHLGNPGPSGKILLSEKSCASGQGAVTTGKSCTWCSRTDPPLTHLLAILRRDDKACLGARIANTLINISHLGYVFGADLLAVESCCSAQQPGRHRCNERRGRDISAQ
ncbi:unnamed protein product [Lepidochelys kempii]